MFSNIEIGIDLGTANILVNCKNKGIIYNEPAVVAINSTSNQVIAVGTEAKNMVGKTHEKVKAIRPLKNGVIADYTMTTEMLKLVIKKVSKKNSFSLQKPNVVIGVPTNSTPVERRAIIDAVKNSGAKHVYLLEETIAAAIGANLPVSEPIANMIVDIGGGTTEVAIISYGGVVTCHSIRVGGDQFDEDIVQYIRKNYNLLIGERTAEGIKFEVGYALKDHEVETIDVRGRDLVSGLPKTITLSSSEVYIAMKESIEQIVETIRVTLEDCPPELSGDIVDRGVVITGGGALLKGIKERISNEVIIPVQIAPNPLESVALGTSQSLGMVSKLQKKIN